MNAQPQHTHVPVADGLRALCVFIVGWYHIWQQSWLEPTLRIGGRAFTLLPLVRTGYLMVDILIMLSGFLLFLPYARERVTGVVPASPKKFYIKRALRILPSYYLAIFVVLFCFVLPRGEYPTRGDLWSDLLPHLGLVHNLFPASYHHTRLNFALWTLAVEAQAYVLFPWVARLFVRKPGATYFILFALGWGYRLLIMALPVDLATWINQLPAFFDVFANGMLAALLYVQFMDKAIWSRRGVPLLCTLCACAVLAIIWHIVTLQSAMAWGQRGIHVGQSLFRYPLSALAALWLLAASHAVNAFQWLFSNRLMRFFAAISFQFYIWHQYLAVRLKVQWRFPPYQAESPNVAGEQPWQWLYTLCCFALAALLATALTYGFERPVAKLLGRPMKFPTARPGSSHSKQKEA